LLAHREGEITTRWVRLEDGDSLDRTGISSLGPSHVLIDPDREGQGTCQSTVVTGGTVEGDGPGHNVERFGVSVVVLGSCPVVDDGCSLCLGDPVQIRFEVPEMGQRFPVAANGHSRSGGLGCQHHDRLHIVGLPGVVDQPGRVVGFAKLIQHLLVESTTIGGV